MVLKVAGVINASRLLHTRDRKPATITLRALSLVEKAELVQVLLHTMLEGPTDYANARWMWSLHGFPHSIQWIMFHGHLDYFQKPPLGDRRNTKPEDSGTVALQTFIYLILSCMRTCKNRNLLKLHLVEGPITYDFTLHLRVRDHTTWFWRCPGTAFGHFPLGPHNFMVTALGSCVKWPSRQ
jgi:hypothetical protein